MSARATLRKISLVGMALASLACAQTVKVKVDGPHTAARLGEVSLGPVPAEGASVEVPGGVGGVPFEVQHGDQVSKGEIPRTEPNPWILAAALGGAACCVPGAVVLGFCVANPGVLVAAPLVLVGLGDLGAVTAGCVAPSWFTLPLVSGCGALGLSPAVAALWADAPPAEVVLPAPGSAPQSDAAPATGEPPGEEPSSVAPPGEEPSAPPSEPSGAPGMAW